MNARIRSLILVASTILIAAACATLEPDAPATRGPTRTSPDVQAAASDAPGGVAQQPPAAPVDTALTQVSRSNPGPEAGAILDLCGAAGFDLAGISGMAKVAHARDLPRYVRLTGREPEIQTDAPAWVVAYSGRMTLPRALGWAEDPICVVIDGERTVFLTGRHGRGDVESEPLPVPGPPFSLPPLAP